MRRRTPPKLASAAIAAAGSTPTWRAAASAASAFIRLCAPSSDQRTRPSDSPAKRDFEGAGLIGLARLPAGLDAESLHRRPAPEGEHSLHALVGAVGHDFAGSRHSPHEVVKLPLDRLQIVEDVGMIELDVVQYCGARAVVDELGALVEEGGVVLVGLDDEARGGRETRGDRKVVRHAADQETGRLRPRARGSRRAWPTPWSCRGCPKQPARACP